MSTRIITAIALTASLLSFAACGGSRSPSYADPAVNTARQVEDIKQNASDQRKAVDTEAERLSAKLDVDERLIRDKYQAERQAVTNASNKEETERKAQIRDIEIKAQHEKDVIDAEVADKLKTSAPEKAAEIESLAASRKSGIDNTTTKKLAPILHDAERSKAKYVQRGLEIDRDESRAMSALTEKRSELRNRTKDKHLKIDKWENEEMVKATAK